MSYKTGTCSVHQCIPIDCTLVQCLLICTQCYLFCIYCSTGTCTVRFMFRLSNIFWFGTVYVYRTRDTVQNLFPVSVQYR
jgi:hypothetical protein